MNRHRLSAPYSQPPFHGTWLSVGSPVIAELAAESGFDWLLFDLEHGCGSEAGLLGNLQAIKGTKTAGIVRVGAPYPDLIMRALDWGADGLMVPRISSAAEAEACVRAMHYPPRGLRGVSRTVRAYGYGLDTDKGEGSRSDPLLMVQIETVQGVEQAAQIAQVPGVDVLFVGPGDLNYDLKSRKKTAEYFYEQCLSRVVEAACEADKKAGILVRDINEISHLLKLGFTHIAIDSDLSILRTAYQRILNQMSPSVNEDKDMCID